MSDLPLLRVWQSGHRARLRIRSDRSEVRDGGRFPDVLDATLGFTGRDAPFTLDEDSGDEYENARRTSALVRRLWSGKDRRLTIACPQGSFDGITPQRAYRIMLISKAGCEKRLVAYTGEEIQIVC